MEYVPFEVVPNLAEVRVDAARPRLPQGGPAV